MTHELIQIMFQNRPNSLRSLVQLPKLKHLIHFHFHKLNVRPIYLFHFLVKILKKNYVILKALVLDVLFFIFNHLIEVFIVLVFCFNSRGVIDCSDVVRLTLFSREDAGQFGLEVCDEFVGGVHYVYFY